MALTGTANQYTYHSTAGAATTTIASTAPGILESIIVSESVLKTPLTTIYDNTAASGNIIGVLKGNISLKTYKFNCIFKTGLTISNVTGAGALKMTAVWKKL